MVSESNPGSGFTGGSEAVSVVKIRLAPSSLLGMRLPTSFGDNSTTFEAGKLVADI